MVTDRGYPELNGTFSLLATDGENECSHSRFPFQASIFVPASDCLLRSCGCTIAAIQFVNIAAASDFVVNCNQSYEFPAGSVYSMCVDVGRGLSCANPVISCLYVRGLGRNLSGLNLVVEVLLAVQHGYEGFDLEVVFTS